MAKNELSERLMQYALRVTRLVRTLPKDIAGEVFGKQLLRCASSVAANYRSACRGKSKADFLSKLKTCQEEADEAEFWLEMISESGLVKSGLLADLKREAWEVTAIITQGCKTTARNIRSEKYEV